MSELVRRHGLLLDDPESSSAAEYGRALEALCDVLSDAVGKNLRSLHGREFPFEIAVRPFFYFLAVQYANSKYRPPAQLAAAPSLESYDCLFPLYDARVNGTLHRLLHQVAVASDPAGMIERLLPVAPPAGSPPRSREPDRRTRFARRRRRFGVSFSLTTFEKIVLSCLDPGHLRFLKRSAPPPYALDGRIRRRLLDALRHDAERLGAGGDEARQLLVTAATLPTFYLEAFDDYVAWVEQVGADLSGLLAGIEFKDDPRFALLVPWLRSHNRVTVGAQHGGTYGQIEPTLWERCERFLFERYVTWGYRYSEQDVPLPAIRLSRPHPLRNSSRGKRGASLVVLPHFTDALAQPLPVELELWALRASMELLDAATPGRELVLRRHPRNRTEDYAEAIPESLRARVTFTAGSRGTLVADARRFDGVIFTEPHATGILECVSSGVDFRIVANPRYFHLRPEARPVFDALIRARIWITDSQAWNEAEQPDEELAELRRKAIGLFARTFIRHSRSYLVDWSRFLREVDRASRSTRNAVTDHY